MFQRKMLSVHTIQQFWEQHHLPLSGAEPRDRNTIVKLLYDAYNIDRVFEAFISSVIIDLNKDGVQVSFDTYKDIEEAYTHFLMGYCNHHNN